MTQENELLGEFRASIDNIDAALIFLLAERFRITRKVGYYKKEHNLPPEDRTREDLQLSRLQDLSKSADIDPEFVGEFFNFITAEVRKRHEEIRREKFGTA